MDMKRSIEMAAEKVRSWPQWKQDLVATRMAAKKQWEHKITNAPFNSLHLPHCGDNAEL